MYCQSFYFYKMHIKCIPHIFKAASKPGKHWKGLSSFVWTPWPCIYLTHTVVTLLLSSKIMLHPLNGFLLKKHTYAPWKRTTQNTERCKITYPPFANSLWSLKTCTFSFWNLNLFLAFSYFQHKTTIYVRRLWRWLKELCDYDFRDY